MIPQVDLSTVSGAGDGQLACDSETNSDYAPDSFWLSKHAELDWLDQHAILDRNDSGKGSVVSFSGSQRYSVTIRYKASIIGLPNPQKPNYADRRTCRPASARLYRNRPLVFSGRGATVSEPSSPKVSCMGQVRSRKEQNRRGKNRKKIAEPGLVNCKSVKERKLGFWKSFRIKILSKGNKPGCEQTEPNTEPVTRRKIVEGRKRGISSETVPGSSVQTDFNEPPGLGGVKRFASGRRSHTWADEVEIDGPESEPLGPSPIWRRRESVPPGEVSVGHSWDSVGPASV